VTHRVQFSAVPWLRQHMQDEVDALTATVEIDPNALRERLRAGLGELTDVVRGQGDGSGLLSVIATPEQRTILDRVSAFMSVIEGHAEFVMNAVSSDVIPSQPTIEERFGVRRRRGGEDPAIHRRCRIRPSNCEQDRGGRLQYGLGVARDPAHESRDRVARRLDYPRPSVTTSPRPS
jgi:putative hydrolase